VNEFMAMLIDRKTPVKYFVGCFIDRKTPAKSILGFYKSTKDLQTIN